MEEPDVRDGPLGYDPIAMTTDTRRDPVAENLHLWNRWAEIHPDTDFYDLAGFRKGGSSLQAIERQEVGDVAGKRLLHLQCHFGLDTLSWARLGADATGVDFSPVAIGRARELAEEAELEARFVESDVYHLPETIGDERFHRVVTTWGVLDWLPDLLTWARIVHRFLEPGGTFHLVEFHPLLRTLDDDGRTIAYPWLHQAEPLEYLEESSYAAPDESVDLPSFTWSWGIGDVVQSLLKAGLVIEALREFPWSPYPCLPYLVEVGPRRWALPDLEGLVPLAWSVRARRPL